MHPLDRDVLTEAPPRERAARVRLLLALGWSPASILADAPYLSPQLVEGSPPELVRERLPASPRHGLRSAN